MADPRDADEVYVGLGEVDGGEDEDPFHARGYCEDYPCCGHEAGDCYGQKYGSDESIKQAAYEQMRMEDEGYYFQGEG